MTTLLPFDRVKVGAPVAAPDSTLSDPRQPTLTAPLRRLRDINGRHNRIYPRFEDRGALAPILGVRQRLTNGDLGGVSRSPFFRGTYPALAGTAVTPATETAAARATKTIDIAYRLKAIGSRTRRLNIVPGLAALNVARAPRPVPGTPGLVRGFFGVGKGPSVRGVWYAQRVAPRPVVDAFSRARSIRERAQQLADEARRKGLGAIQAKPALSSTETMQARDESLARDAAKAAVLEPAQADQSADGGGQSGMNLLMLGAAVFVAVLLVRG